MKRSFLKLIYTCVLSLFVVATYVSCEKPEPPQKEQTDPENGGNGENNGGSENNGGENTGGEGEDAGTGINLSAEGTANCYIVSEAGDYHFKAVKGNSAESVGEMASVEVLWESFGTSVEPHTGDLISAVSCTASFVNFSTNATEFKTGNAVIAAKDSKGNIIWSWHIWLTEKPESHTYKNNAGVVMDRNLGATTAKPGAEGSCGLVYQWGRKDPFMGTCSSSSAEAAKSTITWPDPVESSSSVGNLTAVTANPTRFLTRSEGSRDWYFRKSGDNNTRWAEEKTAFDPCPPGWKVIPGGNEGLITTAIGDLNSVKDYAFDSDNAGINMSGLTGDDASIWYPAAGYRSSEYGIINTAGKAGYYWTSSLYTETTVYCISFTCKPSGTTDIYHRNQSEKACAQYVRCCKE